jgi:hypothetical protein
MEMAPRDGLCSPEQIALIAPGVETGMARARETGTVSAPFFSIRKRRCLLLGKSDGSGAEQKRLFAPRMIFGPNVGLWD